MEEKRQMLGAGERQGTVADKQAGDGRGVHATGIAGARAAAEGRGVWQRTAGGVLAGMVIALMAEDGRHTSS